MKSITFSQALFAVGFIGLTLALTGSWQTVATLRAAYAEQEVPGGWIHAALLVQAIAFAIPVATVAFVFWRQGRTPTSPVRFPQLLAVAGLLGLMLVSNQAPTLFLALESYGGNASYGGPLVAQAIVVAIPLAVLLVARRRRARTKPVTSSPFLTSSRPSPYSA
jgi:hypothetical protein